MIMKYTKKLIRTGGGLVVRVPSDIVKLLNLTEKDYVEIDLTKLDVKLLNKKTK
jgi:antitoxin component of MazEF toxin-antitoxin module